MKQHATLVINQSAHHRARHPSPDGRYRPRSIALRTHFLTAVVVLVVWLYGVLVLGERRSGYVITLDRLDHWDGDPHSSTWRGGGS